MVNTIGELRYSECLKNLAPVFRACASCDKLYECLHGKQVVFGDMSITDKVVKLDWCPTIDELKKMTYQQLCEFSIAHDSREQIKKTEKRNKGLTAGCYDSATDSWSNGKHETKTATTQNRNLTAGYWDEKKKRWVSK